ncbi:MAG: (2Fe-2S)-binding protein [Bacteroidales bacterium]|nr:(2Fe-2S)-binding protein [Bacteroidales bacterium]
MRNNSTISITINGIKVKASNGDILLNVLNENGIKIPTLCHLKGHIPQYPCRICLVYNEIDQTYIPSCSTIVSNGMSILTHTPSLIKKRQQILEMLLSSHPDDCLYCVKNDACHLRMLASELSIDQRRFYVKNIKQNNDKSSAAIVREYAKCVLCGKCIEICNQQQCHILQFNYKGIESRVEPVLGKLLNQSNCVYCGQCIMVCPTASLYEKENISAYYTSLDTVNNSTFAIISPLLEFDFSINLLNKSPRVRENQAISIIKNSGANKIFNLNAGIDLYLNELLHEFIKTKNKGNTLISGFCPSAEWYLKKMSLPDHYKISKIQKPIQILQQLLLTIFPNQIFQIHSFTTCLAEKQLFSNQVLKNKAFAYTVRELLKIKNATSTSSIRNNFKTDEPFHLYSGLSFLPFIPGGLSEALARMIYQIKTQKDLEKDKLESFRNIEQFSIQTIVIEKQTYIFGIINGIGNVKKALENWKDKSIDFIEILACPNGCVMGGGSSFEHMQNFDLKSFEKQWYENVERALIRYPQRNLQLMSMLEEAKNKTNGEKNLLINEDE